MATPAGRTREIDYKAAYEKIKAKMTNYRRGHKQLLRAHERTLAKLRSIENAYTVYLRADERPAGTLAGGDVAGTGANYTNDVPVLPGRVESGAFPISNVN